MSSLTKAVAPAAGARQQRTGRSAARALYGRACDPEASLSGEPLLEGIRAELRSGAGGTGPGEIDALRGAADGWAADELRRYCDLLERVDVDGTRAVLVRRAALGCAPLALVSGAWLQWMSSPGNADDPVTLRVLRIYAADVGVGQPRASRGSAYLALLQRLRLSEHAVPAVGLTLDQRIPDWSFALPSLLLAMSRRPDDFRPEILGADLCLRTVGLLPALAVVRVLDPAGADWNAIDPSSARQPGSPSSASEMLSVVESFVAASERAIQDRVALGFAWALSGLQRWSAQLYRDVDASRDPAYEMAELLRLRAREGAVYHGAFNLEDRPFSEWLKGSVTDPRPLLSALARSRFVKPGHAEQSALVTGLIGEGGPMYRVFSREDVTVIRRWIDSLKADDDASGLHRSGVALPDEMPPILPSLGARVEKVEEGRAPVVREAYHLLQTRHDSTGMRRFALAYVRGWLRRSCHGVSRSEFQLPSRWDREGLRPWLVEQHDRHSQEFEGGREVPLPSREELIDSTVQLAPLTLIDGSWLQGFTDYHHASSEIGHFLFATYWDELGNGEPHLNHPLLYREVLHEMGICLPSTASLEFARWPGFRDRSFELPVYWLCIGRFPQTFMPEALGLNLAMELSGVGGAYRQAHIALETYGFSTRFVDIHNTIDNVATGHSAWAADAVDTYMASIPSTQTHGDRDEVWERVQAGYRSLNPPDGFWARYLGRRAQRRTADGARRQPRAAKH